MIQGVPHTYTPEAPLGLLSTRCAADSHPPPAPPPGREEQVDRWFCLHGFFLEPAGADHFACTVSGHRWHGTQGRGFAGVAPARGKGIAANLTLYARSSQEERTQAPHAPIVFFPWPTN